MSRIRNLAVAGVASLAAVALTAPPASAASTTVRTGNAAGPAYSGAVSADLLGLAVVNSSLGGGTCNESNMTGSVQSDGTGLTINSASFSNNGGNCSGTLSSTITATNLPWSGGTAVYAPVAGGRDGTVTIANFRVRATINIFGGINCNYGGNLTANAYNPDNPNRPDPAAVAQAAVNNATVNKINSGSSFLCPSTATVTATYALTGGGTTLYLTS